MQEHGLMISVLHIQNVSEKDSGLYKCDVSDDRGSACNNVTLIVDEKGISSYIFKGQVELQIIVESLRSLINDVYGVFQ